MTVKILSTYLGTCLVLFFLLSNHAKAQYSLVGLDLDDDPKNWYDKAAGINGSTLYEGTFYDLKNKSNIGHQFYEESYWTQGQITFRNQVYADVYMLYDLVEDILVIRNPNLIYGGTEFLKINQEHITSFNFHKSKFKRYDETSPPAGTGFYEVIHDNKLGMVVKRKKVETLKSLQFDYHSEDRYYLVYKEDYILFKSKRNFFQVLPTSKKDIKSYIKKNRLRIKRGNKSDLRQLLQFINKSIVEV